MQQSRLDIELLLRVAASEFAKHGFEATSMRTLAELCSVTQPAIYYHFNSKEALYEEVCSRRFDDIARAVDQRVATVDSAEREFEEFFSTLFDEWHRDNTILLLTQREVINALTSPERCVAGSHTTHLFGLIESILSRYLGREVDEDIAFTFGALLFGYCSLMSLDIKGNNADLASQREQRKAALLDYSRKMLRTLAQPAE